MRHTDTNDYNPLGEGKFPPSSAKIRPITTVSGPRDHFFQFDEHYEAYRSAKIVARDERVGKFYRRLNEDVNLGPVLTFIVEMLLRDHSDKFVAHRHQDEIWVFNNITRDQFTFDLRYPRELLFQSSKDTVFLDPFDALAMQLQCDLVLVTARADGTDYASHIHLFHPNGWSAEGFIGKSFTEIHEDVKNSKGQLVLPNPSAMVQRIIKGGATFERVGALSFRHDAVLDRHPDKFATPYWGDTVEDLFLRFERQTLKGIPEANSFLFSIHTVIRDLATPEGAAQALSAVKAQLAGETPDSYMREVVTAQGEKFLKFLESKCSASE